MGKIPFVLDKIIRKNGATNYRLLEEHSEELSQEIIPSMNNTVGLEDGRWIRIVNIGDGSVRRFKYKCEFNL